MALELASADSLDLGSTAIKSGSWFQRNSYSLWSPVEAPPLRREGFLVEGDADAYACVAERRLEELRGVHRSGTWSWTLGLSCQRSSFVLWERATGRPVTPLVSWMDRRAVPWCRAHSDLAPRIEEGTLLRFSPQYAGPKLAHLLEGSPDLYRRLESGEVLFGTLDSFLVWRATNGKTHETDLTMAARTLLVDPREGDWSEDLLSAFGVPRRALPRIVPSVGREVELVGGGVLRASLADQAAAVLGALGTDTGRLLVNLGTGAFVLRPLGAEPSRRPGFLVGPMRVPPSGPVLWAAEGPVNGVAAAWDEHGCRGATLPDVDPDPEAFCLPETAGVGAPHWRAETPLCFSEAAERLPRESRARLVVEGIVFRVREIVEGLRSRGAPSAVVATGGMSRSVCLLEALAAVLDQPILAPADAEASLAGAGASAAGVIPEPDLREVARPGERGAYLREKYDRWRAWVAAVLRRR